MCLYLYIHNKYTQYTHICIHKCLCNCDSQSVGGSVVVDKHVVIRKPGPHLFWPTLSLKCQSNPYDCGPRKWHWSEKGLYILVKDLFVKVLKGIMVDVGTDIAYSLFPLSLSFSLYSLWEVWASCPVMHWSDWPSDVSIIETSLGWFSTAGCCIRSQLSCTLVLFHI